MLITILTAAMSVLFIMVSMIFLLMFSMDSVSEKTTDPQMYGKVMKIKKSGNKGFSVFPKKIPANATDVEFSYNATHWQDPYEFCHLSFKASSETIQKLENELAQKTKEVTYNEWLTHLPSVQSANDTYFFENPITFFGLSDKYNEITESLITAHFYLFTEYSISIRPIRYGAVVFPDENLIIYCLAYSS